MKEYEEDGIIFVEEETDDQAFIDYMKTVDKWLVSMCGLASDDLPDYSYRIAFEDKIPPRTCARKSIRWANGF